MNKKIVLFTLSMVMLSCAIASNPITLNKQWSRDTINIPKDAIPFNYIRNHICIRSKIDTITGDIVFDSGADGLYLDSIFFKTNPFGQFKYIPAILPGIGSSGGQKVEVITDKLNYSSANFSKTFSSIPIFKLKPILGDYADGIIGVNAFSKSILEINYKDEYLRIHKDFKDIDTSKYERIRMIKKKNRLHVPITIKIKPDLIIEDYLLLDIGSGGTVSIINDASVKYNFKDEITDKVKYFTKYGGVSGNATCYFFKSSSFEIGNYKFDSVLMDYSIDKSGALSKQNNSIGLLGNDILDRFDVIIDFINNDIYLKPNSDFNYPFQLSKLGFNYVDRSETMNSWIVTGFFENSNAQKSGLQIDDKIISVNGKDIHNISYKEQEELWDKIDNLVLIVIRNNKEEKIEFKL